MAGAVLLPEGLDPRLHQRGEGLSRPLPGIPPASRADHRGVARFAEIARQLRRQTGAAVPAGIRSGRNLMQSLASLLHGDQVRVRRSAHKVRFLHPRGWSYYATLRRKLRWYEDVV